MMRRNQTRVVLLACLGVCLTASVGAQSVWESKTPDYWANILAKSLDEEKNKPCIREQWYAAYALEQYGAAAQNQAPTLLRRLDTDLGQDDYVRSAVARALGTAGATEAIPALILALDSEYLAIRRNAAWALGRFSPDDFGEEKEPAVEALRKLLKKSEHPDLPLELNAATALWRIARNDDTLEWIDRMLAPSNARNVFYGASAIANLANDLDEQSLAKFKTFLCKYVVDPGTEKNSMSRQDAVRMCVFALAALGSVAADDVRETILERYSLEQAQRGDACPSELVPLLALWGEVDSAGDSAGAVFFLASIASNENEAERTRVAAVRGLKFAQGTSADVARKALLDIVSDTDADVQENGRGIFKALDAEAAAALKALNESAHSGSVQIERVESDLGE
ncbi:MAG: HEAT repeat domain-containing protein [Planctomycetia bacterium]|nr:HEAT repeat domain-containing protein [Planctomycetia bacterium]